MKKFILFFIILNSFLYSKYKKNDFYNTKMQKQKTIEKHSDVGISIAFKPSYLWFQDKIARDIYKGGFLPLLEVCYNIRKNFHLWLETGYFYKKTDITSINIRTKTNMTQVPLSVGLNYTFYIYSLLDIYLKIGQNWVYTKTYVDIPNLKRTVIKNGFGITLGFGGKIKLVEGLFLEPFLNYLYDKEYVHDSDSEVIFKRYLGGLQIGAGIGYRF
jgi:hypothetical protein